MKLSISNIAWTVENDIKVHRMMQDLGYTGLEIAPTRIIPDNPYDKINEAISWKTDLMKEYGFEISSMQSIWFGRTERIFGSKEERESLLAYTKKAIRFAEAIGCRNLVFGCPRNRIFPINGDLKEAHRFFRILGDYAFEHRTVLALEANPPIYNTNFINTTRDAIDLIEKVDSNGFLLNLDIGTMIENGELVKSLEGRENLINHVHISEPKLKPIQKRSIHREVVKMLNNTKYKGFVSIEMGCQNEIGLLSSTMDYVRSLFE